MVGMATARLTALAAWPTATLHHTGRQPGRLRDAEARRVPPRVPGLWPQAPPQAVPQGRLAVPGAHRRQHRARLRRPCTRSGLVVGDVSHANLFVAADATVRFIDADSMQVVQGTKRHWPCEVGVEHAPAAGDAGPGQLPRRRPRRPTTTISASPCWCSRCCAWAATRSPAATPAPASRRTSSAPLRSPVTPTARTQGAP